MKRINKHARIARKEDEIIMSRMAVLNAMTVLDVCHLEGCKKIIFPGHFHATEEYCCAEHEGRDKS